MSTEQPPMAFHEAIRLRYPPEAYVTMFEVANATGFGAKRWADALAFSLWPSRGHDIEGFEFKETRSDWIKERDNPAKANAIWQYCHRWWLVIRDAAVAKVEEVPDGWGIFVIGKKGLRQLRPARRKEATPPPAEFIGAMLRAAAKQVVTKDNSALWNAREKGRKEAEQMAEEKVKRAVDSLASLQRQVADFERESGISFSSYRWRGNSNAKEIGEAIEAIANGSLDRQIAAIEDAAEEAARLCSGYRKAVEAIRVHSVHPC